MHRFLPYDSSPAWIVCCAAGLTLGWLTFTSTGCELVAGIGDRNLGQAAGGAGVGGMASGGAGAAGGGGIAGGGGGAGGQQSPLMWSKQFGSDAEADVGTGVAASIDRVVVAGRFGGEISFDAHQLSDPEPGAGVFVAAFDGGGSAQWATKLGSGASQGDLAVVDLGPDDTTFVAATLSGGLNLPQACNAPGDASPNVAAVKLDDAGSCLVARAYGGVGDQHAHDLSVGGNGVSLVGVFANDITFGGPGDCGNALADGSPPRDIFVVSLDMDLGCVWREGFAIDSGSEPAPDHVTVGTARDSVDNTYVAGSFRETFNVGVTPVYGDPNTRDGFVVMLDSVGDYVWHAVFSGSLQDWATHVAVSETTSSVWVAGTFRSPTLDVHGVATLTHSGSGGDDDIFLVRLDTSGTPTWSKRYGSEGGQRIRGLAVDASGNVLLMGDFDGSIDFGGGKLTSADSNNDVFMATLDPDGNHQWSRRFGGDDKQAGLDGAFSPDDEPVLTGVFKLSLDLGGGPLQAGADTDGFLAKFNH